MVTCCVTVACKAVLLIDDILQRIKIDCRIKIWHTPSIIPIFLNKSFSIIIQKPSQWYNPQLCLGFVKFTKIATQAMFLTYILCSYLETMSISN